MNRGTVLLAGASALSTTIGVVAGVLVANKRLEKKYVEIAEKEIQDAKDFYARWNKDQYATPEDAVLALVPIEEQEIKVGPKGNKPAVELFADNDDLRAVPKVVTDYSAAYSGEHKVTVTKEAEEGVTVETTTIETPEAEVVVEKHTVFVDGEPLNKDDWDLDAEMEERRRGNPYVIDEDTYNKNETDFDQITFTYFRDDDTVVDERDMILERVRETLGDRFSNQFGFGSGNRKAVYIRNEKDNADYEVILHEGSYREFKGFIDDDDPTELRHSAMRRARRSWDE